MRLSRLLLGCDDRLFVARRIRKFAETFLELAMLMDALPDLIETIWAARETEPTLPHSLLVSLDGMAFESFGASVNWYCSKGLIPDEAAVLWTARLSYSAADLIGFDTAVIGLCDFLLAHPPGAPAQSVLSEMAQSLLTRRSHPEVFPLKLLLVACTSLGSHVDPDTYSRRIARVYENHPRIARAVVDAIEQWRETHGVELRTEPIPNFAFAHFHAVHTVGSELRGRIAAACKDLKSLLEQATAGCLEASGTSEI